MRVQGCEGVREVRAMFFGSNPDLGLGLRSSREGMRETDTTTMPTVS